LTYYKACYKETWQHNECEAETLLRE